MCSRNRGRYSLFALLSLLAAGWLVEHVAAFQALIPPPVVRGAGAGVNKQATGMTSQPP